MSTLKTTPHDGDDPDQHPALAGLAATARVYERWGWLVLRAGDRLLLAADAAVSAVEMPSGLAGEVQQYLSTRLLGGPVIALPGAPCRWLLLTESADEASTESLVRLRARGALIHRCGTLVPLPPSRLESGCVSWRVPPSLDGPKLPPFTAVGAAARAVSETAGLS